MRILVGWKNPQEIDLLELYLGLEENDLRIETDPDLFLKAAAQDWDVVLFTTNWPDVESAFETFRKLREIAAEPPIVAVTQSDQVYHLAQYLTAGLRSYLIEDPNKDYMFLLHAALSAAVDGVRAERERLVAAKLRQEIDSVRKLQESIIPRLLDVPHGYQLEGRYEPSEIRVLGGQPVTMAGGDYYNALKLPDGNIALIVGDASGHGMKACMSIMSLHTLLQMFPTNDDHKTASFVREINRNLCQQAIVNDDGGFITLLYGVIDLKQHTFEWSAAGHPLPILQDLKTGEAAEQGDNNAVGMPLGVWEEAEYEVQKVALPPSSRMLLYSDGLAEAFHEEGETHTEFGIPGIIQTLRNSLENPLSDVVAQLFADSHDFTRDLGRHDDTSVLLIQRD